MCKNATYSVATLGDGTKPSPGPKKGGGLLGTGPRAGQDWPGTGGSSLHDGFARGGFSALHVEAWLLSSMRTFSFFYIFVFPPANTPQFPWETLRF